MDTKTNVKALVLRALLAYEKNKEKCTDILKRELDAHPELSKKERALFSRLYFGVIERMIRLDFVIDTYAKTKVKKMKPAIAALLRMAVYQITEMDSVAPGTVVDEAVNLAAKFGFGTLRGFVNGILRNIVRSPEKVQWPKREEEERYICVMYSLPAFLAQKWLKLYGFERTENICRSFLEPKKTSVVCRYDRADTEAFDPEKAKEYAEALRKELEESGFKTEGSPIVPFAFSLSGYDRLEQIPAFADGRIRVQDAASAKCVLAAGIKPHDRVLDVCAAPGGKSLMAADILNGTGEVIARDISEKKAVQILENIQRCGFSNIYIETRDACDFDEKYRQKMDVVIVDAPCSGYGVIGKKPDIKYTASAEKEKALSELQKKILRTVKDYVRPGGTLVYSTCTFNPLENQENVKTFLRENSDFTVSTEIGPEGFLQLMPDTDGCDGFFISVFRRKNEREN